MNHAAITSQARHLHREIWNHQDTLWPDRQLRPIDMLDPQAACSVLGLGYQIFDNSTTAFSFRGQRYKVAGLIDRQSQKIAVASALSTPVARFTAAHEVGHWILHPNEVMHRDRPVDGSKALDGRRSQTEREADYFAGAFLMPEKLLAKEFQARFGSIPYAVNETVAYWLNPSDPETLLRAEERSLERELALAKCRSLCGRHFTSLAEAFKVSPGAMAIRLNQLSFIRWP
ncbi:MAG: methenyltetrahydrofolate cyclohydrolase [Spongiibacteraceae bacterium]|nr:methenyltetrahydrofolate cyclohydrolase [Spongiibacteraceae bacterium]